jgi:hypothetical protein
MNIPAQPQLYNQVPPNYAYNNQYNQMNTRYQIPQQNYPNIFQAPQNNYMYQQNNPQYSIPSRMIMQNVPNNQALTNRLNGTKYNNTAMTNSTKRADNLNEKSGIDGLIDSISSLF